MIDLITQTMATIGYITLMVITVFLIAIWINIKGKE